MSTSEYGGGLAGSGCRMMSSTGLLVAVVGSMMSQLQLIEELPKMDINVESNTYQYE